LSLDKPSRPALRTNLHTTLHCALAVGGLDPGGGAGILADLRAFAASGVFGCAALAVVTVQSTAGLRSARALPAREVVAQAEEVLRHQDVRAVKVGALGSPENVRAVARLLGRHASLPAIIDTPIRPSRGLGRSRLTQTSAIAAVKRELLPRATVLTVNLDEAAALLGLPPESVRTVGEAHDAARSLAAMGARAVLVKGGHRKGPSAIDVLAIDGEVTELRAKRLSIGDTHGTGCTLASLIAGRLARNATIADRAATRPLTAAALLAAVRWAKRTHYAALARAVSVDASMDLGAGDAAGDGMRVMIF
jgi:hydroxymethylpyrimidine/phosphomethylpyrimidine kinase